jgi:hypothetical protein
MAITAPVTLGSNSGGAGSPTALSLSTSAAVPSGAVVFMTACWGATTAKSASASGGSVTWATDQSTQFNNGYFYNYGVFSAPAPVGVTIGSSLTITASALVDGIIMDACYSTGLDTSGTRLDIGTGAGAAVQAWNTGSATTTNPDCLKLGGSFFDGLTSSTAGGSSSELYDFQFAGNAWTMTTTYEIVAAAGSQSLTGTWLATASHVEAFAAYKGAAAATSAVLARTFNAIPFMTGVL